MKTILAAALCGLSLAASAVPLVENGVPKARIVATSDETKPANFAAKELASYLEKITGAKIEIAQEPGKNIYNVFLPQDGADARKILPEKFKKELDRVRADGFLVASDADALYLCANHPRGVIYAAYEILKKYGDVRWFFPTPDGEYCPKKATFDVPEQVTVDNPRFTLRSYNLVCYNRGTADEMYKWQLRNKMIVNSKPRKKGGSPEYAIGRSFGGHCFKMLLPDSLYDEHPEYFCLVNGQRIKQGRGGGMNQPCTSNPGTVRTMCDNMKKFVKKNSDAEFLLIMNNDSQTWCECAECKKLDPPDERAKGRVCTRFWILVNQLVAAAKEANPNLICGALGYQNFQEPPAPGGVQPCKDLVVPIALHQRCFIHDIGDESCIVNARFRRYLKSWNAAGVRSGVYEYTNMLPGGTRRYNPLERIVANDIKYYASQNCDFYTDEVPPLGGIYQEKRWGETVTRGHRDNFLVHYMQAYFLWNPSADFETVCNDAGSKFYGAAWPEMREFRRLLEKAFVSCGIHMMYGTRNDALGKVIADPAVEKQLLDALDKAKAKAASDPVLAARVANDADAFAAAYLDNAKQFRVIRSNDLAIHRGTVHVDGDIAKKEWRNAVTLPPFKRYNKLNEPEIQTTVKAMYDDKNLYLAIEALEPQTALMRTTCSKRDELVWKDNSIEMFFAPPSLDGKYVHLVFNAAGAVFDTLNVSSPDSDLSFDSGIQIVVKTLSDRWTVELALPFERMNFTPAKGAFMPFNIARNRLLTDNKTSSLGSWNGSFHGAEIFYRLLFE